MKFLSVLKKNTKSFVTRSLPLPCQQQPRTLSFNGLANNMKNNDMLKTINSVYNIEAITNMFETEPIEESPDSIIFTDPSLECASNFSSVSSEIYDSGDGKVDPILENVIGQLRRSDRIFFQFDESRSIVEAKGDENNNDNNNNKNNNNLLLPMWLVRDSVTMAVNSKDPYEDFKNSMEEMVNVHGLKDNWEALEDLLCHYLKINGEINHGFIVSAFVDLILGVESSSSYYYYSSSNNNNDSPLSFNSNYFQASSSCGTNLCIEGGERESHNLKVIKEEEEEISTTTHEEDGNA